MENSPPQNTNKPDDVDTGIAAWLKWLFAAWGFLLFVLWGDEVELAYLQEMSLPGIAIYIQNNAAFVFGGLAAVFVAVAAAALTGRVNNKNDTQKLKGYVLAAGGGLSMANFPLALFSWHPPYSGVLCAALWVAFLVCAGKGAEMLVPAVLRSRSSAPTKKWLKIVIIAAVILMAVFLWHVVNEIPPYEPPV